MNPIQHRRDFLRGLGAAPATLPFLSGLPSLCYGANCVRKQRLVVMFSPNGTIPSKFWPKSYGGDFQLNDILEPLQPWKSHLLQLKGIHNKVKGDGDRHMRGMSCLLTGIELFPGNVQGGSDTPSGWAKGISIDQEIKNFLQRDEKTRTRFGSLEFGVGVSDRADPWTRMSYSGANKPVAPTDDPYQMYRKLYGQFRERQDILSILDEVHDDLKSLSSKLGKEDRELLGGHMQFLREMEQEFESGNGQDPSSKGPGIQHGIANQNDNLPQLGRMQIDMLVNSFANDFARVATLQYTKSVGQAKMNWLNIQDSHHTLSHKPDKDLDAFGMLTKINTWFAGELSYLVQRLAETPEPGGDGTLLDNTLVLWANELGKGNNHTLDNIPFVAIGGAPGFKTGRALDLKNVAHNRLLLSIAHAFGHNLETFGNPQLSQGGPLDLG